MKEVSAVELRQSLGKLARTLERDGEPVLLKLRQRTIGVIVPLKDFRERFALAVAAEERARLVQEILGDRVSSGVKVDSALTTLRRR